MNNKTSQKKLQAYSSILNICHLIGGNNSYWKWSNKNSCYIPLSISKKEQQEEKLVSSFLTYTNSKKNKDVSKDKTYNKLAWFREMCKERTPTDEEIKLAARIISDSLQYIQIAKKDGSIIWFEGNAKGTAAYNKKQDGKIKDTIKEYMNESMDAFFLTLTCDPKKYKNLADCWENYLQKEVYPITEPLRKHCGMKYVGVMESTAKCRPHIHIVCFVPKGTFPELKLLPNKKKLSFGKLYNYVKKHKFSEQTYIEVAKGDGLKYYCTKYLAKGIEQTVFQLLEDEKKLSKADLKALKEFVFLTAFKKRKALLPHKKNKKNVALETKQAEASITIPQEEEWGKLTASEKRSILNSICINSPLNNPKTIYSMSYDTFADTFGYKASRNQNVSDENADLFESKGRLVYEERNFFTDFVEFVQKPLNSPLNRKFYWNAEENIYDLFTDNYDLNNDEDFLKCCRDLINMYLEKCCRQGYNYAEVLSYHEGLSFVKKIRHYAFNQCDYVVSLDPKEVYYTFDEVFKESKRKRLILEYLQKGYSKEEAEERVNWELTSTAQRNIIIEEKVKEWKKRNENVVSY